MKQTGFRVDEKLYLWLKEQAEKEHRSINNYLLLLVLKEKEKHGDIENEKEINI